MLQAFAGTQYSQADALSKNLAQEAVVKAQAKVRLSENLRMELLTDLEELDAQLDTIKKKVVLNLYNNENLDGLLKHPQKAYDTFLHVDTAGFRSLINADVQTWQKGLKQTQADS